MATITKAAAFPAYTISGNSPEVRWFHEGYGCSFKIGSPVVITASGRCRGVSASGNVAFAQLGSSLLYGGCLGLAARAATTTANWVYGTKVPVYINNYDTVFAANIVDRFVAAQSTLPIRLAASVTGASLSQPGTLGGGTLFLQKRMVGATGSLVKIRGLMDDQNDLNGRVYFTFISKALR